MIILKKSNEIEGDVAAWPEIIPIPFQGRNVFGQQPVKNGARMRCCESPLGSSYLDLENLVAISVSAFKIGDNDLGKANSGSKIGLIERKMKFF
jgi:hypothetical protein